MSSCSRGRRKRRSQKRTLRLKKNAFFVFVLTVKYFNDSGKCFLQLLYCLLFSPNTISYNPRFSGEGQRPIFDRDDIVVNQDNEERVILSSSGDRERAQSSRNRSRSRSRRDKSKTPPERPRRSRSRSYGEAKQNNTSFNLFS